MKAFPAVKLRRRRILAGKVDLKMGEYKFYAPDGKEIGKEEFVCRYSGIYYLDYELQNDFPIGSLKGQTSKTSRFIEEEIDNLISNGMKSLEDVMHVIAWKMDRIKQRESDKAHLWIYHAHSENTETGLIQTRQGKKIDCSNLSSVILTNHDLWIDQIKKDNPQAILDILAKEAPEGIGTVYFITLLYFISLAEYPIYDQFAKKAIDAITFGAKPNTTILYKELPDRNNPGFSKVSKNLICFKNSINDIFGYENYKASRDIDRALWVYGHLFKGKSKSAC